MIVIKKNEAIGETLNIRGRMHMLGWSSIGAWARAHGYPRTSVYSALGTWGTRTDRAPHGQITLCILKDLRATLCEGRRPESLESTIPSMQSQDLFSAQQAARS